MSEAFKQVGNLPYYWHQQDDVVANVYLDHAAINWHIKIISSSAGELADEVMAGGSKEQAQQAALVWLECRQEQETGETTQ
jgi:hypothetical protein